MAFLFGRHQNNNTKATSRVVGTTGVAASTTTSTSTSATTTANATIQDNLVRIQTVNHVSDKYDILESIGKGSMGAIYKVRIKPHKLGGSAFHPKPAVTTTTTRTNNHSTNYQSSRTSRWKARLAKGIMRTP